MADRTDTRCDQCGQIDDHPKVHLGQVTKHNDCLAYDEEVAVRGSAQPKSMVAASAIIDKCKSGTKGAKLLAFIEAEHAKTEKESDGE